MTALTIPTTTRHGRNAPDTAANAPSTTPTTNHTPTTTLNFIYNTYRYKATNPPFL
jgi:hypothetical protein